MDYKESFKEWADKESGVGEAGANLAELLNVHLIDHESVGCTECNKWLGIQKMPVGYALMLNADERNFYWLRYDGKESEICVDKWAVYRGAKADAAKYI